MPARILIVDSDATTILWLHSKLTAAGYTVDTANRGDLALQKIAQEMPDLVVIDPALSDGNGLDLIRRVRADPQYIALGVIVLSAQTESDAIMAGLNAGADHYVLKRPGADVELEAKIRAWLAQPRKNALSGERGRIFSFCSAKGGTGTTSVCINTAYALTKLEPRAEILIVDMVFPIGSVGPSLAYDSRKTMVQLSQEPGDKIDRILVEKYVSQLLKWGFRVLIGANDPHEAGTLDVSRIVPIFSVLKTMYDYVLVDFGRTLSRISLPIIENSSAVVVIVTPDISTVKASRVILEFLETRNMDRNRLILINNRTVGRVWTTTEDIERELKLPLAATVPYVVEYMTMAINESVPFMDKFPEHAAGIVLTDLARRLQERDRAKK
ncbi:MAG: response regulator [Anaerolineales bacterium]|nr:response regulator [Anaerolineales bacterium]